MRLPLFASAMTAEYSEPLGLPTLIRAMSSSVKPNTGLITVDSSSISKAGLLMTLRKFIIIMISLASKKPESLCVSTAMPLFENTSTYAGAMLLKFLSRTAKSPYSAGR